MNVSQKILVGLALTLSLTFGVLLAWQLDWFGWDRTQSAKPEPAPVEERPVNNNPVPDYLDGIAEPLPSASNEKDDVLHEDPQRVQQKRKQTERYLAGLKTAQGRVIGTYQTSLAGHNASGRVKNIVLASQKLNGTILLPGEILSFNTILGDSNDPRSGWQLATVIVGKEYVDGYGGGICQVSSTLYNSVLRAGLKVRERYTHSLPVGYVQPGQDATVSYPELDFRFVNSIDTPIRVETVVEGEFVIARLLALPAE